MFLSPEQIEELTHRKRHAAQARALNAMGIHYKMRADGTVAVHASHVAKEFGAESREHTMKHVGPDWGALSRA